MSAYGDFVRKCCERTKHEATKATESSLTRYEWRNDHLAVIIRTNSVRYSAQDKNKTVLQWCSQDLKVGEAQGVWGTEVPQRGPGAKPLVGGSGGGIACLLYTSPSPRDGLLSRMPSSA